MTQTDQKPGGGLTRTMRIILAVLVVAVLAAGGVYYAMLRDRASTTQASQEAAVGGDILAMVNGEAVTREAVEEIYAYFVDEYGYYYDLDDPDTIAMFWNASIMYAEQNLIMMQKGRELGVLPLTEEESAGLVGRYMRPYLETRMQDLEEQSRRAQYLYRRNGLEAELLLREDGSVQMIRRAETPEDYFATAVWE